MYIATKLFIKMLRTLLFCFFIFFIFLRSQAQQETIKHQVFLFTGIGNYEYLHAGINIPVKTKYCVEIAAGVKPWGFNKSNYQMAYLSFGRVLLREQLRKIQPYLSLKILTWHFNNRYNEFVVLSVNPELRLSFALNEKMILAINGGLLYNSPFYYERKTYLEVGWPKEWQPSFSMQFLYRIK